MPTIDGEIVLVSLERLNGDKPVTEARPPRRATRRLSCINNLHGLVLPRVRLVDLVGTPAQSHFA